MRKAVGYFQEAIDKDHNYSLAYDGLPDCWVALGWYGYLSPRRREAERARELDPVSNIINTWVGSRYYFALQYDKAIEHYRTAVEMDPAFVPVHLVLGQAYAQKQMYQEAIAELQRAVTLSGHSPGVCGRSCPRVWCRR